MGTIFIGEKKAIWFPSAFLKKCLIWSDLTPLPQADERYRKNIQGSPQTAPPPKQPPLPPRSSEPFSNGGSSSEASAMHRPMEPQVTPAFCPPLP